MTAWSFQTLLSELHDDIHLNGLVLAEVDLTELDAAFLRGNRHAAEEV